jgi:hypothetical protein
VPVIGVGELATRFTLTTAALGLAVLIAVLAVTGVVLTARAQEKSAL